ncbi:MAG: hypothetical protein RR060_07880 [Victivallaceae bacterium]
MKKLFLFAGAVTALFAFSGCSSVEVAQSKNLNGQKLIDGSGTIAHVNVQNDGFYFLKWPIAAGSTKEVGTTIWLGDDTVNVPGAVDILTAKSKEMKGSAVVDVSSIRSSTMIPIPFPFLFYMKSVNVSGNVIK